MTVHPINKLVMVIRGEVQMDGNKLKGMRIEKGLSLTKLSQLTGISKSYLSLIEREIQRNPSLEILEKLAQSFDMKVEDLVKKKMGKGSSGDEENTAKSVIKIEIELAEEQINLEKLKQIKEFIYSFNNK